MKVFYTLTSEMPTYCIGLWGSRAEAVAFCEENNLASEGLAVTPVFSGESHASPSWDESNGDEAEE